MELLKITSLEDSSHVALFQSVASRVYQNDPIWSPVSEMMWKQRFQQVKQNSDAFVLPMVAVERGQPVARCMLQIIPEARDEKGHQQAWISFFEYCKEFEDAAKALLVHAEDLSRQNKAPTVLLPKSDNQLMGLLTSGFELPHFVFTNHNPSYYFDFLKSCDYIPKTRMITYYFTRETAKRFTLKAKHLKTREFNRKNLDQEIKIFHDLQSKIFEGRPGYVPRSFEEDYQMVHSFLPFLVDEFVIIAETSSGEPVGLLVCIPDMYQSRSGEAINRVRIITIGAIPGYTNKGVGVLMGKHLMENLLRNTHYESVEGSMILSHNLPVHNLVKRFGAQPGKEYWVLEKGLSIN